MLYEFLFFFFTFLNHLSWFNTDECYIDGKLEEQRILYLHTLKYALKKT